MVGVGLWTGVGVYIHRYDLCRSNATNELKKCRCEPRNKKANKWAKLAVEEPGTRGVEWMQFLDR